MFKKSLVFLLGSSLASFLFTFAFSLAVVTTFNGSNIKNWFSKHNVYQNLADSIVKENKDTNVGSGDNAVSISQPEVQAAIKQTITPEFLQRTIEAIIDGTEPWLKGKIDKPNFNIDVSGVKNELADNLANAARDRYVGLPLCARGQVPSTTNPLEIECRIPGLNIEAAVSQLKNDILKSEDFLPNQYINADNFSVKKDGQETEKVFDTAKNIPKIYQWILRSPFIFAGLSLIAAVAIWLLSADKRRGLKRIGVSLLSAGIVIVALSLLVSLFLGQAETRLATTEEGQNAIIQNSIVPLVKEIKSSAVKTMVSLAVVYIILFAAIITYLHITKKKVAVPSDNPPEQHPPKTS